ALCGAKRGELVSDDIRGDLATELGAATENLNRRWCEKRTGYAITGRRRVVHPVHRWMAADVDGRIPAIEAVFSAEFVQHFSDAATVTVFMPQLQHDMWVTASRCAVLSVITGDCAWVG